jgi:hypothetical protein
VLSTIRARPGRGEDVPAIDPCQPLSADLRLRMESTTARGWTLRVAAVAQRLGLRLAPVRDASQLDVPDRADDAIQS